MAIAVHSLCFVTSSHFAGRLSRRLVGSGSSIVRDTCGVWAHVACRCRTDRHKSVTDSLPGVTDSLREGKNVRFPNPQRFRTGPFAAAGVPFSVETNREKFAAQVEDQFRDLKVPPCDVAEVAMFEVLHDDHPSDEHPWGVWLNSEPRESTVSDDYVLAYLLWEVTQLLFEHSDDRLHLHGAAVALEGCAVVLAGHSHAGKSTLAGWLTYRGWGFLTDEVAVIDPADLVVHPFWRPIGVRRPGPLDDELHFEAPDESELLVPASSIGCLASATPLKAIVFPEYAQGSDGSLQSISPAAGLAELTSHFPALAATGREGFRRLAAVARSTPTYKLTLDDLDDAERQLRQLVVRQ